MKYDIILAGVGGQGILSVAAVIATAAMESGLQVRQSEVHGMAQRGGAVQAHLRISDSAIHSDLIGNGRAEMILSMEPLESLRYLNYLSSEGVLITAAEPFSNIPNYPDLEEIHAKVQSVPLARIIPTKELATKAGSIQSANMVLIGAAMNYLPLGSEKITEAVSKLFGRKGELILERNLNALELGRQS